MPLLIRDGLPGDVPAITAIYGHAVLYGNASFELEPPDTAEIARRRDALLSAGFPYLVAEDEAGRVVGYSHGGTYRTRPGYRFTRTRCMSRPIVRVRASAVRYCRR